MGNNPVRYTDSTGLYNEDSGYSKQEITYFKKMNTCEQLSFLKNEIQSVQLGTTQAGAKAEHMRKQLKSSMKLKGLFYSMDGDEVFMNETLRSFLNLNKFGLNYYSYEEVSNGSKDGWFQMYPPGDSEHQSCTNGGRNIKYCNKDGREAIFDAKGNFIGTGKDAGTYNYGYVANLNPLCITLGSSHGQYDMKPFFRQMGTQPWY